MGSFVDMVLFVKAREEKKTTTGDLGLWVYGIDIDGHNIGPIRLWGFGHQDMEARVIYIIRGLKVVIEPDKIEYIRSSGRTHRRCGVKLLEASWRTAIENVSEVPEINAYFDCLA